MSSSAAALADRLERERQPRLWRTGVTVAYAHGNASEDPQLWGNVDQILWGCATIGAQFLSAYFGPGSSITLARRPIPGLAVGEEQNVASFRVEEPPGDSGRVVGTGARIRDEGNRGRIVTSLTPRTRVLTCGGGSQNPQWMAMREAMLGVPTTRPENDAAAYGAAIHGGHRQEPFRENCATRLRGGPLIEDSCSTKI